MRRRNDLQQAKRREVRLDSLLKQYEQYILDFGRDEAQVWGRLRVPHPENALDRQIAATALTHDLKLVTRNTEHFAKSGLDLVNPFE